MRCRALDGRKTLRSTYARASELPPNFTGMNNSLAKIDRWRKRAEECRTLAEIVKTPKVQKDYIEIAKAYDTLAKAAEADTSERTRRAR